MVPRERPERPERPRPRRRWFSDAIIAGFVATGASTAALLIAFAVANGAGDSQGDTVRQWLYQLTHNEIVQFSRATPAVAIAAHVVLGVLWALVYARFVEFRPWRWLGRPGWQRGMIFSLLPWLVSLLVLLPAAAVNLLQWALSAGPLPPLGNLLLHLIYGFVLGQLYDASADAPALGGDVVYEEPLARAAVEHSEDFGAAGILVGAVIGAAVGIGLAVVLPPTLPNVDFAGWEVALAVGGILAGGSVGGIVGSFAGLPNAPADPVEAVQGPDPFERNVLPFLIPPFLVLVIAAIIVSFGFGLLRLGKSTFEIGPIVVTQAVVAAIIGIVVIASLGTYLASRGGPTRQSASSMRETVSHSDH